MPFGLGRKGKNGKEQVAIAEDDVFLQQTCKYVGSMAIVATKAAECQRIVNEKLLEMKDVGDGISVIMQVASEGIKVLDENASCVKMAHGITRIAFSTCQPNIKLFAYCAKTSCASQVNGSFQMQAHMFKCRKSAHSQQISVYVSKAFKVAYMKSTVHRKERVKAFESEAEERKKVNQIGQKKRWAKQVMAHGHDYARNPSAVRESRNGSEVKMLEAKNKAAAVQPVISRKSAECSSHGVEAFTVNDEDKMSRPKEIPTVTIASASCVMASEDDRIPATQVGKDVLPLHENIKIRASSWSCTPQHGVNDENSLKQVVLPARKFSQPVEFGEPWNPAERVDEVEADLSGLYVNMPFPGLPERVFTVTPQQGLYVNTPQPSLLERGVAVTPPEQGLYVNTPLPAVPERVVAATTGHRCEVASAGVADRATVGRHSTEPPGPRSPDAEFLLPSSGADGDLDVVSIPRGVIAEQKGALQNVRKNIHRVTFSEEDLMAQSEWYQGGLPREFAEGYLLDKDVGSFIVRDSLSQPGFYVLTVRIPDGVKDGTVGNYLVERNSKGYCKIKGYTRKFASLVELIAHYGSVHEDIPCRLKLSEDNPLFLFRPPDIEDPNDLCPSDSDYEYEDLDYDTLNGSEAIMSELEVKVHAF